MKKILSILLVVILLAQNININAMDIENGKNNSNVYESEDGNIIILACEEDGLKKIKTYENGEMIEENIIKEGYIISINKKDNTRKTIRSGKIETQNISNRNFSLFSNSSWSNRGGIKFKQYNYPQNTYNVNIRHRISDYDPESTYTVNSFYGTIGQLVGLVISSLSIPLDGASVVTSLILGILGVAASEAISNFSGTFSAIQTTHQFEVSGNGNTAYLQGDEYFIKARTDKYSGNRQYNEGYTLKNYYRNRNFELDVMDRLFAGESMKVLNWWR